MENSYNSNYGTECGVCFENVGFFKSACCNQPIHTDCFQKCINLNGKCPFCRNNVIITINTINTTNTTNFTNFTNFTFINEEIPVSHRWYRTSICHFLCFLFFVFTVWIPPVLIYQIHENNKYKNNNINNNITNY